MNSEKVKEIKKGLEDNATREHYNSLWYMDDCKCITVLYADILTLINELESENEKLLEENESLKGGWENAIKRIAELEKEVETRKEEVLHLQEYGKKLIRETELKQFAERLKEKCHNYYPSIDHYCCSEKAVNVKDIDELLKEDAK